MPLTLKQNMIDRVLLICLALVFLWVCWMRHSSNILNTINSDPKGYYFYLPAVFVAHSVHNAPAQYHFCDKKNEKGEIVEKYTCGVAIFYLPFFLGAHLYAHLAYLDPSGYSEPYCYALMLCGVFWGFAGIFLLRKLLLRYFARGAVWLTLLCIMLGTNFFNYATLEMAMSHVYSFFLFSAILLSADSYYRSPSRGLAILIGFLEGWAVLVRPTNIMLLVFLVLYRVVTRDDLRKRILFLRGKLGHALWALPFFFVTMVPQFLYWKTMTGHWVTYSYNDEGFRWLHPYFVDVLFDTQNGLFLYSPILLFAFWGLIAKRKDAAISFWGLSIVFLAITYIFASWSTWSFGAAFGHRCYVEYFTVIAFPLAATMDALIRTRSYLLKVSAFLVMGLFCYYNIALDQLYVSAGIWEGEEWRWNYAAWWQLVQKIF